MSVRILAKNFSANIVGQMIILIERLALVPLYLAAWGVRGYGVWLTISALPALLATVGDGGLVPVTGNEMAMSLARGDERRARSLFDTTAFLLVVFGAVLVGLGGLAILTLGPSRLLGSEVGNNRSAGIIVCVILITVVMNFWNSLQLSALRAVNRTAEGIFGYNICRAAVILATVAALSLGATQMVVALLLVLGSMINIVVGRIQLRHYCPWLFYGRMHPSWTQMRHLLVPSATFLGLPVGIGLLLQGLPIAISHALGASAVTIFVTTRTLANVPVQLAGSFSWSAWPIVSRHYGAGERESVGRYFTHGLHVSALIAAGGALSLVVMAGPIFAFWTRGRVEPSEALVLMLSVASFFNAMISFPGMIVTATNRFHAYAAAYVVLAAASVVSAPWFIKAFGIIGPGVELLGAYAVLFIIACILALRVVGCGHAPLRRAFIPTGAPLRLLVEYSRAVLTKPRK